MGDVVQEDCVFDRVRDGTLPADIVFEDTMLLAFLDIRPLFPGHTLVVPRAHLSRLETLDDELAAGLFSAGRRIAAAQRLVLGSEGTFLALNDGVSQSVPHVHLHVVPRRRGDGLRGFFLASQEIRRRWSCRTDRRIPQGSAQR